MLTGSGAGNVSTTLGALSTSRPPPAKHQKKQSCEAWKLKVWGLSISSFLRLSSQNFPGSCKNVYSAATRGTLMGSPTKRPLDNPLQAPLRDRGTHDTRACHPPPCDEPSNHTQGVVQGGFGVQILGLGFGEHGSKNRCGAVSQSPDTCWRQLIPEPNEFCKVWSRRRP